MTIIYFNGSGVYTYDGKSLSNESGFFVEESPGCVCVSSIPSRDAPIHLRGTTIMGGDRTVPGMMTCIGVSNVTDIVMNNAVMLKGVFDEARCLTMRDASRFDGGGDFETIFLFGSSRLKCTRVNTERVMLEASGLSHAIFNHAVCDTLTITASGASHVTAIRAAKNARVTATGKASVLYGVKRTTRKSNSVSRTAHVLTEVYV